MKFVSFDICAALTLTEEATDISSTIVRSASVRSRVPFTTFILVKPEISLPSSNVMVSFASAKINSSSPLPSAVSFTWYLFVGALATL